MTKKKMLLAASVAGLMAAAVTSVSAVAQADDVHCYGINKCKGTGDCGGKGNSCKGTNACKGQGFLTVSSDSCTKISGGRLTAEEPKS